MNLPNYQLNQMSTVLENSNSQTSQNYPKAVEIQEWLVTYLADLLEIELDEIDTTIPFDRYGIDSSAAVSLTGDLEDWLKIELDPDLLYDYPTIEALVNHLVERLQTAA